MTEHYLGTCCTSLQLHLHNHSSTLQEAASCGSCSQPGLLNASKDIWACHASNCCHTYACYPMNDNSNACHSFIYFMPNMCCCNKLLFILILFFKPRHCLLHQKLSKGQLMTFVTKILTCITINVSSLYRTINETSFSLDNR